MNPKKLQELNFLKTCLTGINFKKIIRRQGIEIKEMSKVTKISRQTFYNWIHNTVEPTNEAAIAVAKYLGIIKPSHLELLALTKKLHALEKKIERLGA
jgi:transcriptional regulator with XRE-family HTH domain